MVIGLKPIERRWLLDNLNRLTQGEGEKRILFIDDEEVTRYWLKGLLATTGASILETPARSGGNPNGSRAATSGHSS